MHLILACAALNYTGADDLQMRCMCAPGLRLDLFTALTDPLQARACEESGCCTALERRTRMRRDRKHYSQQADYAGFDGDAGQEQLEVLGGGEGRLSET